MSKEVQMTFRVERELRAEFADAALLEDRPAAQVLREFMRAYVNQSRACGHRPANDAISPAESRRREAAVNFARSSVGLEGFKPSPATETGARQFIKGDIQLADFVQVKPDAQEAGIQSVMSHVQNRLNTGETADFHQGRESAAQAKEKQPTQPERTAPDAGRDR